MNAAVDYTPEELQAIRQECAPGATDSQFTLFLTECKSRNLVPGRHVIFQLRRTSEYDSATGAKMWVSKPVLITTIPALRLIAQRSGEYLGQGREKYIYLDDKFSPTVESSIPLPDPKNPSFARDPWVAEATVYRKGFTEPMVGVARFEAYASTQKNKEGELVLTRTWSQRNCEMLSKCAEALALRKAFPEECAGLLLQEELKSEEDPAPNTATVTNTAPLANTPAAPPPVNQVPAEPTSAPRPGEKVKAVEVTVTADLKPVDSFKTQAEFHTDKIPATLPAHSGETLKVVSPDPEVSATAENPVPAEKVKKTRKSKSEPLPDNGRNIAAEGGITQADIDSLGKPVDEPAISEAENKAAAEAFVAGTDPTPNNEELKAFSLRIRALTAKGHKSDAIRSAILEEGKTDDPKKATVAAWNSVLSKLEAV
jgi:phage recombination protein Bet